MRRDHFLLCLACALFLLSGPLVRGGEPVGPPDEPNPEVEQRLRAIMVKKKTGQEVTPEEQQFLEQHAPKVAKGPKRPPEGPLDQPPGGPFGQPPGGQDLLPLIADVDVVDRALLTTVLTLAAADKRDEALATAEKVIAQSPDQEAVGFARLIAGRLCQQKGQTDQASKLLRSVTGRAAPQALTFLVQPLLMDRDVKGMIAAFKDLLAAQNTGLDRCRLAKAVLDLLDRPGPENLPPELRVDLLATVAAAITYDEAVAAKDALAKERAQLANASPRFGQRFGPFGADVGGGKGFGPPGFQDVPPELLARLRDLRELPPDQRQAAMFKLQAELKDKAARLEKEGREAEAAKLREQLERLDRFVERLKDGPRAGGFRGGKGPPDERRDPDRLRAEIKKLEDQGFMEEAKKLRRELDAIEPKADEKF